MVSAMLDAGATSALAGTRFSDVRWFESIGSTNAWLVDQARQGAPEGLVAVADHQDAGRGRLGRSWVEPPGSSLLTSVLLRPELDAPHLHLAAAAVALAAADACQAEAGVVADLKWPNDLVVGGAKLAGVLAEADLVGGQVAAVVVGVGLNVNWPAGAEDRPPAGAVALNQLTGSDVGRAKLLVAMLASLEARCQDLAHPIGRLALASAYRGRCVTVGQVVRIQLADETFIGTAADVSPEGHLLVEVGTCLRRVTAADVVHLRPA